MRLFKNIWKEQAEAYMHQLDKMEQKCSELEKQVAYLTNRLETQAKLRSAASKKGWRTRKSKEER